MKKVLINLFFILSVLLFTNTLELAAQGRSNERPYNSGNVPGRNKGATGVPIDGGAGLLLAAGAAYGLKKLNDFRNKAKNNNPNL